MTKSIRTNPSDILSVLCKHENKWGMYLSWSTSVELDDLVQACPILNWVELLNSDCAYITYATEAEMLHDYNRVVGDDGPTIFNSYDGPCKVYAETCDPSGKGLNENT